MIFELEYLGKIKFMYENNLGQESGDQRSAFDELKLKSKISRKCTFNYLPYDVFRALNPWHVGCLAQHNQEH
jgi:hypothetical protein